MLSFLVIACVVFVFFWIRLQPIEIPKIERNDIAPGTVDAPTVTFVNPSRGALSPKVTIIEYGDFECDACALLNTSIEAVLEKYPDDVKHVWKDLPNESAHPLATPAAIAAHCADQQGRFWEYHDELFERQTFLSESQLSQIAFDLELDTDAWSNCYASRDTLPIVRKDYEEGLGLGLIATPTVFIGDDHYVGAISTNDLMSYVEQALEAN